MAECGNVVAGEVGVARGWRARSVSESGRLAKEWAVGKSWEGPVVVGVVWVLRVVAVVVGKARPQVLVRAVVVAVWGVGVGGTGRPEEVGSVGVADDGTASAVRANI